MNKKQVIIKLIRLTHILICSFLAFGFLLPLKFLKYHLVFFPLVLAHWATNNDKCFVTELEQNIRSQENINEGVRCYFLRNTPNKCSLSDDYVDSEYISNMRKKRIHWQFIQSLIYNLTGKEITKKFADNLCYITFGIAWFITFIRLLNYKYNFIYSIKSYF